MKNIRRYVGKVRRVEDKTAYVSLWPYNRNNKMRSEDAIYCILPGSYFPGENPVPARMFDATFTTELKYRVPKKLSKSEMEKIERDITKRLPD